MQPIFAKFSLRLGCAMLLCMAWSTHALSQPTQPAQISHPPATATTPGNATHGGEKPGLADVEPGTVIAAVPRHFPPYYHVSDGKPAGFAIDLMEAVARQANFTVEYIVFDNWSEVLSALADGRAQLIPNMGISTQRARMMDFSLPLATTRLVLFTRRDAADMSYAQLQAEHKLAVVETNIGGPATSTSSAQQIVFPSIAEAMFALLSKQVDAVVYPEGAGWRFAVDSGVAARLKVAAPHILKIKRAVAVAPKHPDLLNRINQALTPLLVSEEYKAIYRRWYGTPPAYWDGTKVVWLFGVLGLLLGACFFTYRYRLMQAHNRRLVSAVAERDRALQEMSETQDSLNLALQGSQAGVWDMHFKYDEQQQESIEFYPSPQMKGFLGFGDDEMPNSLAAWRRRILVEDRVAVDQTLEASKHHPQHPFEVEYRARHKDGSMRWLHCKGAMICDATGRPLRCTGFEWDVTTRKHYEKQIQETKRALETLINNIPGITYRCQYNRNWTMEFISDYCYALTGYRADEFILDRSIAYGELIHPEDRDDVWNAVQEALIQGQSFCLEYRIITLDGETRWVQEQGSGIYDADQPIALEGVIFDMSASKLMKPLETR